MWWVRALLLLVLCRGLAAPPELREPPKKIAVIGAGIGGTAAAFYLRQEFGASVKIDVFESGPVGGRLATEEIGGHEYETGGSTLHPLNLHMKHFVERLGLSARPQVPSKLALFDGSALTFEESDWFLVNFLRMLWRYGLNPIRVHMWVEGLMDKFMRIYEYQQLGYAFTSAEKLLHAVGGASLLALLNQTLEEAMLAHGFSQAYINDVVTPVSRFSFLQSVRLHALAGAVALTGADGGRWAVHGGNKKVCSGLLYSSRAELIPAHVTSISLKHRPSRTAAGSPSSLYEVNYATESGGPAHSLYDIVVVATPLHQGLSDIAFAGFSPPLPSLYPGRYRRAVSTLVLGVLNVSYFDPGRSLADFRVTDILTTDAGGAGVAAVSAARPVRVDPVTPGDVWRVSSDGPLSEEQLGIMFARRERVVARSWLAYPSYRAPERRAPPFVLHRGLYYISAIEWAAASVEMSAISARNAALLARHRWQGQAEKVDQEDLHSRLRGEL